jgi:P4 family phage/plasmid primase-like protien
VSAPTSDFTEASRTALESRALDVDFALESGVRPVRSLDDLPDEFAGHPFATVPGMLFPWKAPETGEITWQYRPDTPVRREEDDQPVKYVFAHEDHQKLALVRGPRGGREAKVSLVVEGTMQSLAAARFARDDIAVYAIPGCWGWSDDKAPTHLLSVLVGSQVVIVFDADAASNRMVYDAGARMIDAVQAMAGVEPTFARLGSGGSVGLDDLLSRVPAEKRRDVIDNLIDGAKKRPADVKPKAKAADRESLAALAADMPFTRPDDTAQAVAWVTATGGLHRFLLRNGWRSYRRGRWDDVPDEAVGATVAEVLNAQAETYASMARDARDRDVAKELETTAAQLWSNNKISSVLGRAARSAGLHIEVDQMDRHPNLWCANNAVIDLENGEVREHDPALLMSRGSDVDFDAGAQCPRFDHFLTDVLPDDDVREFVLQMFSEAMSGQVSSHILPVFLGPKRNGKSTMLRIMLALFGEYATLLPEELVVETGRAQVGEMEKLQADLFGRRLATFEETKQSVPWNVDKIKNLTGGGRMRGRQLYKQGFQFDPSHTIVMATNHQPHVRGSSEEAFWARYREVPFTVSLEGREDPSLERGIIAEELPGVLNRVLAAGARRRAVGALVAPAAVMAATETSRMEESPFERFATSYLIRTDRDEDRLPHADVYAALGKWWEENGDGPLPKTHRVTADLQRALGLPLHRDTPESRRNPRQARIDGRRVDVWFGLVWKGESGPPNKIAPLSPLPGAETGDTGVTPTEQHSGSGAALSTLSPVPPGPVTSVSPIEIDQETAVSAAPVVTVLPVTPVTPISRNSIQEDNGESGYWTGTEGRISGQRGEQRESTGDGVTPAALGAPVVFDLETADADQLYDHPEPREFVRIAGRSTAEGVVVDTGPAAVIESVLSSQRVIGHNVVHFDLPALARVDDRVDVLTMTRDRRVLDTMITESVLHPILNDKSAGAVAKAAKWFKLDAVCERRGIGGKVDEIARLAKLHGGFDQIPVDDPDYRTYVAGDVGAARMLAGLQAAEIAQLSPVRRDYLWREHRVHAIAAMMGAQGFLVDQALLQRRFWAGYNRKNDLSRSLIARYDIPTTKADGKPADSPAATKGGKEAILAAFASLGVDVDAMERTPKGSIAFGKEPMGALAQAYADSEEIVALAELVADVNGVRTVYGTALESLRADGRVHPEVATFQASGRWSVRKPGLTVFGKRNGRHVERAVFTAAPGNALFAIDLSQIDSRAIAVHSQDHAYLDLFLPGRDAHEIVARMVWGDAAYDADRKILRDRVKAITHGLPYGMGLEKLVATTKVPEAEAQRVIDTMNERFPRLQAWKDEVREQAAGGELDNGFGRIMMCEPSRAYTQGPALIGQGCARDLMMQALLNLPDFCIRMLRAQVHDEAVFEVPLALAGEIVPRIERAFNFEWAPAHAARPVQVVAEAGPLGTSWSECYG